MSKKAGIKLTMRSNVKTLSLKFYAEQIGLEPDATSEQIRNYFEPVRDTFKEKFPEDDLCIFIHDKDSNKDDVWEPSIEKLHVHVIWRTHGKPAHVSTVLNRVNVHFRKGLDDNLIINHGIETINNFKDMVEYLPHKTSQARKDGKHEYEWSEMITTYSMDELLAFDNSYVPTAKLDAAQVLMDESYKAGFERIGWMNLRKKYKNDPVTYDKLITKKMFRARYNDGVDDYVSDHHFIPRAAIFIQGSKNVGKSYAVDTFFQNCHRDDEGSPFYTFTLKSGQGTGKFDELDASYDAMVVDDCYVPTLLSLADTAPAKLYRRNSDNQYFVGEWLVILSNKDLFTYCKEVCHIGEGGEDISAILSRFYEFKVIDPTEYMPPVLNLKHEAERSDGNICFYLDLCTKVQSFMDWVNASMKELWERRNDKSPFSVSYDF